MSAPVPGDPTPDLSTLQGREIGQAMAQGLRMGPALAVVLGGGPAEVRQLPSPEFTVRQDVLDVSTSLPVVHLVKADPTRARALIRAVGGDIIVAPTQAEAAAGRGLLPAGFELDLHTTADIYVRAATAGGQAPSAVAWCERWTA